MSYREMVFALALVFTGYSAYASDPEVFKNQTAGFQVTKPAEWHYVTAAQNLENIKAAKLTDKEFHAAMLKYATAPLVAMTKFPEPYDDLNPSFKVNVKPYGQLKGQDPAQLINLLVPQFKNVFKDFDLAQPPTEVIISGIRSAYARMNYTLQISDGRSFPTTSELWIVPHGEYFFVIGAGTRQDENTGSRKEIAAILETVKIQQ
jgi:hypothetical protein